MRRLFESYFARKLVTLVALLSLPLTARAENADVADAAGLSQPVESTHVLDATGYTLPARTLQLGLFYFGYGVTDWLSLGTQPGPWALGPPLGGLAVNLSIKGSVSLSEHVHVGLEANPIWLSVDDTTAFLVPVTLGLSVDATSAQSYSLAVRYVAAEGASGDDLDSQDVEGAAITRLLQLVFQAQYQLSTMVAFYSRVTVQPWEQNLRADGAKRVDERTTLTFEGEAAASEGTAWAALGGIHFTWGVAHLLLGLGYGNYFVPGIGLPVIQEQVLFPDLDFYVRF